VHARITGGVFQDFAPSPLHMHHTLAPLVASMGARVSIEVARPGYVPAGAGTIDVHVTPSGHGLQGIELLEPGAAGDVRGVALSSHLAARRVSDRMADACEDRLRSAALRCTIDRVYDETAAQAGACLAVWTDTNTGCRFGADRAGKFGRRSEAIGTFVAAALLEDLQSGGTVDRFLADQLVVFCALAGGRSSYVAPRLTSHLDSNLWLAGLFGAGAVCDGRRTTIEGLAVAP
jgi:RNA 3'-terminal phosphate cyclase (ATP)